MAAHGWQRYRLHAASREIPAEVDAFYQRTRRALLDTVEGAQCLWIPEATMEELNAEKTRQGK